MLFGMTVPTSCCMFGNVCIIFVEATGLSEFTNYVHILRSVPHNHDVVTLVRSWQQCDTHTVFLLSKHSEAGIHILRSVPHNHDVATLVPSWQQCVLLS